MEYGVLGPLQVLDADRTVRLGPRRQQLLLAILICRLGAFVSTQSLLDALWGPSPPESASGNLYLYVHRLRKELGADRITGRAGYILHAAPDEVDAYRFTRLAEAGLQALEADPAAASKRLHEALALWRGPAFTGLDDLPSLSAQATSLDEQRLTVLEHRVDADLALGRHAELTTELATLTGQHPYRERFYAQRMLALYRSGRQAEALAAYRSLRTLLAEDLGVDPGTAVQQLHQAILRTDPALNPPTPGGVARLKATGPRAPSATPTPQQLPADVADFTGRAGELRWLEDRARDGRDKPAVVITVITGTPGVGKTALAVHWSHATSDRFPDGQLYANLRGYDAAHPVQPDSVLARFLRALGVSEEGIPANIDEAASRYRSALAGKRVLVVLDNAGSAEQVRPLLPGDHGCLVIVTSRDSLSGLVAKDGAHRLTLDVLDPADAIELLRRLVGRDRVGAEPQATAELSSTCDQLPLALRIVAAHLTDHPDRTIAAQVAAMTTGDRLALLRVDGDEASAVRVAFHHSYAHLTPPVARLFRLLSLAPGPDFTAEAAAALIGGTGEQAGALLDRLATVHLIERRPNDRYAFHDLLRAYAGEQCDATDGPDQRERARARLYRFYLARSDAAARVLFPQTLRLPGSEIGGEPFPDRTTALAWLDAERANLVSVGVTAATLGPHRETAWLLADALRRYFWHRAESADHQLVAEAGLAAATAAGHLLAQAGAEVALGTAGLMRRTAIDHLHRALTLSRQVQWTECEATALGNLAIAYSELGHVDDALEHFRQAAAVNERIGRLTGRITTLGNLGLFLLRLGNVVEAREHLDRAVSLDLDHNHFGNTVAFLNGLGRANGQLGNLVEALDQQNQAMSVARGVGDIYDQVEILSDLAMLYGELGDEAAASRHADEAVTLSAASTNPTVRAIALAGRAVSRLWRGDSQQAVADGRAAVEAADHGLSQYMQLVALAGVATAEQLTGDTHAALGHAGQVAQLARTVGYRYLEGQALATLAAAHLDQGDAALAAEHARRAFDIHRECRVPLGEAIALAVLARALPEPDSGTCQEQAVAILIGLGITDAAHQQRLLGPPDHARAR